MISHIPPHIYTLGTNGNNDMSNIFKALFGQSNFDDMNSDEPAPKEKDKKEDKPKEDKGKK